FDDALVSGRGTTVKCTNCGHQFKVRKADGSTDDRWVVTPASGGPPSGKKQPLVFLSLKELQRAILAKQVGRQDTLTRGNASPRMLGSIAELAPFFEDKKRATSMSPPSAVSLPPPLPRRPSNPGLEQGGAGIRQTASMKPLSTAPPAPTTRTQ